MTGISIYPSFWLYSHTKQEAAKNRSKRVVVFLLLFLFLEIWLKYKVKPNNSFLPLAIVFRLKDLITFCYIFDPRVLTLFSHVAIRSFLFKVISVEGFTISFDKITTHTLAIQ